MTELLFIAITIFFIYVVFQVVGKQEEPETTQVESKPAEAAEAVKQVEAAVVAETVAPTKPASKPVAKRASKASTTKPKAAAAAAEPAPAAAAPAAASAASDSIKNPKTGEVVKITGNYAFAKRWIKDALVEEGLLDKVYKNNELDAEATAKIQAAMQKLKAMAKYQ